MGSQGRDDDKNWKHGAHDTLRDTKGGAYGTLPGKDDPENVKMRENEREREQWGADVRPASEAMPETLPEGLQRPRIGPDGKEVEEKR